MSFNLGTAEGRITIDGSGAQRGFSVAEAAAAGFTGAINAKVNQVENFGQRLVAVGTAGVAGFGVAVKAASGFEASLSSIQAVSGATEDQMEAIRTKALQLGKDTVFSASESSDAMGELVKAGMSVEEVLGGAADATVNLAAAGGISLTRAAEIASAAMNQFGLTAEKLPKVADLIAGAANASSIDVEDFGQALNQAGGVANLVGVSFDDLAVAIAEMGKEGYRGSDAGTSLKTMLLNLQPTTKAQVDEFMRLKLISYDSTTALEKLGSIGIKPLSAGYEDVVKATQSYVQAQGGAKVGTQENAEQAGKLMRSLGVLKNQFFDAEGNLKSFGEMQGILADATKNMTKEQRTASLELMFGQDAIRAAGTAAKYGSEGFSELAGEMGKISAADVAKTRMDNLKGSVEQLKGSFETAMIIIGSVVLPVVRKIVDGAAWLIDKFNDLPAPIQKAVGVLVALASGLSLVVGAATLLLLKLPLLLGRMLAFQAIGAATKSIGLFFTTLRAGAGVSGAVAAMGAPWAALGSKLAVFGKMAGGVVKALGFLRNAIGWPVAALIAMAAYVVWAYKNLEGFRNTVDTVAAAIKAAFQAVLDFIKPVTDWFQGEGSSAVEWFSDRWQDAMNWIKDNQWILEGIAYVFSGILLVQMTRFTAAIVVWVAKMIWGWTTTAATSVWSAATQVASWVVTAAKAVWAAGVYAVQTAIIIARWVAMGVAMTAQSVIAAAAWALSAGASAVRAVASTVAAVASIVAQWLVMAATATAQAVRVAAAWLVSNGTAAAAAVARTVVAVAATVGGWIMMAVTAMANAVIMAAAWFIALGPIGWAIAALIAVVAVVAVFWDDIVAFFKAGAEKVSEWMTTAWNWIKDVWNNIVEAFKQAGQMIVDVLKTIGQWILDAFKAYIQFWVDLAVGIWNAVQMAWNYIVQGWNNIINFIKGIPGWIAGVFASAASWLINAGMNILQGLWNGITSIWNGLISWVRGIPNWILGIFSGAGSWLLGVGRDLISGLWNGITGMFNWVMGKIRGFASSILNGIKSFFGIGSPSKLFRDEIGKWLPAGLAIGVEANTKEAIDSVKALGLSIMDNMPDMRNMLQDAVSLDISPGERKRIAADMVGATASTAAVTVGPVPPSREVQDYEKKVVNNHFESKVYNPVAEKASDSEARRLRTVSAMGAFG